MELVETVAYAMRYWFAFVFVVILAAVAIASYSEYREKKRVMEAAQDMIGYLEVVYSPTDSESVGLRLSLDVENSIGSSRSNDLVIDEEGVAERHARIFSRKDGVYLMAQEGDVFLNGGLIDAPTQLFTDDMIALGGVEFCVSLREDGL